MTLMKIEPKVRGVSLAGASLALLACASFIAPAAYANPAVDRDTLVIAVEKNFNSLDAIRTNTPDANRYQMQIYDSLFGFDPKGNLHPRLALEVAASDDAKTYTYKLRPGVKFHDGTAFNAADVKFSMERILDPETKSTRRPQFAGLVEAVETPDDETVVFKLSRPDGAFPNKVAGYLAIYAADPAVAATDESYARAPVSVGPYKVKSFADDNQVLELERFDDYWGGAPAIKTISFRVITENTNRVNALITGEVDMAAAIPTQDKERLEAQDGLSVFATPLGGPLMVKPFANNPDTPYFKQEVRQALNYAVDKEAIIKHVLNGVGEPLASPISRHYPYGGGNIEPYPFDPANAKELLAKAGYPNGFETKLFANTSLPKEIVESVSAYWSQVGVKVDIQLLDYQTYVRLGNSHGLDPIALYIIANPIYDPIHPIMGHFGAGGTWTEYENPEVQALIDQVIGAVGAEQRGPLFEKIGQILHDDAAAIYLSELFTVFASKSDLNWEVYTGSDVLNFGNASWK